MDRPRRIVKSWLGCRINQGHGSGHAASGAHGSDRWLLHQRIVGSPAFECKVVDCELGQFEG
jgi:hypothetical protein